MTSPPPMEAQILTSAWKEVGRRKTIHAVFQYIQGKNYTAPVESSLKEGAKVLDLQISGGAWAIDMANAYPNSTIVTIDIVGARIDSSDTPDNCTVKRIPVDQPLPFDNNTFDFVFLRYTFVSVKIDMLATLLRELRRVLKPGCYFEWVEPDIPIIGGPLAVEFFDKMAVGLNRIGFDGRLGHNLHEYAVAAGFRNAECSTIMLPVGYTWDDVVGRAFANEQFENMKVLKERLCRSWQISAEEYERRIAAVHHEWNHIHKAYFNCGILVARKSVYAIDIDDPQ